MKRIVTSRMKQEDQKKRALSATMGAVGMSRRVSLGRLPSWQKKVSHTVQQMEVQFLLRIWQHILSKTQLSMEAAGNLRRCRRRAVSIQRGGLRKHETWNYRGKKCDHNDIPCIVIKRSVENWLWMKSRISSALKTTSSGMASMSRSSTVRKPRWGAMAVGTCWMNRPVIR